MEMQPFETGANGVTPISCPDVISIGRSTFDPIWSESQHADSRSELIHVLKGRIEIETKDYTLKGSEGDTIYVPTGLPHRDIFSTDSNFEVYLVQFEWAGEQSFIQNFYPDRMSGMTAAVKGQISTYFDRLYQEFISDNPFSQNLVCIWLMHILYTMRKESWSANCPEGFDTGRARRIQIMEQARSIIREQYKNALTLDYLAGELNISPYYLSRVFSKESGFTLSSYITKVRMENAARLLSDPKMNVSEVAYTVGFKDSHYFSFVFKDYFGICPKEYRSATIIQE